jgi:hypothetical protein
LEAAAKLNLVWLADEHRCLIPQDFKHELAEVVMKRLVTVFVLSLAIASTLSAQTQVIVAQPDPTGGVGVGSVVGFAQAPPRDNQQVKSGTATLRGRVVAADSGQPLRKAQIRIISTVGPGTGQFPENRLATTDGSGRYEFKELPSGRYTLTATKGSYVSLQYGQLRPFEPGKPLEILDGQTIERIDFALPRGGVITGQIRDEVGEPIADVQVSAMRYQYTPAGRRLMPSGRQASTNDIGEFRLFALMPGEYYVSATFRNQMFDAITDDRSGYAPTYYPGTTDVAGAQRVTVGVGQTVTDISMVLSSTRTARVSGTAVDSQGRPLAGMVMALSRLGMFGGGPFAITPNRIRPDGSFTISGLTPGDYTLQVQSQGPDPTGEFATADITVGETDITGVRLVATLPSNGSGRIVFTDSAAAQSLRPSALRVMPAPVQLGGIVFGPGMGAGTINEDWTFQVKLRPSMTRLNVTGPPAGWAVKSIRYRGSDVTDSGIDVKPNEEITEIEVELTNRVTEVSGRVATSGGVQAKDYWAIVFARDREKWQPSSRYVRSSRPDQDGRFKISGLPAGAYLAVAVDSIEPGQANDPEFLDRVQNRGIGFSLGEGEAKALDLKLTQLP